jgi:hypothetical protein
MALNDEMEKLKQAEEWLRDCDVDSQVFQASWEHVCWAAVEASDEKVRARAWEVIEMCPPRKKEDA